jgi:hypothetical protein
VVDRSGNDRALSGKRAWQTEVREEPLPVRSLTMKPAIATGPWYSYGWGGMLSQASSVSSAIRASVSPPSTAVVNCPISSRSRGEPGTAARSRPPATASSASWIEPSIR